MNVFLLSLLFCVSCFAENKHSQYWEDEKAFSDLLKSDEQIHLTPPIEYDANGKAQPTVVKVNMLLRAISHVSDENMEYQLQFTFREEWRDPRLAWGNLTKHPGDFIIANPEQKIWKPDTFFQNEISGHRHEIDEPNVLIRVHRDGNILYSVRITMTFSCLMDFHYYPMDVQHCSILFASYAHIASVIDYQWRSSPGDPIQIKAGLLNSLPQYKITNVSTDYCTSKTNTGTYSCGRIFFVLTRRFDFFLIHLYLPSAALVMISWISFWLHPSNVPGRIALGLIVLLSSHILSSGLNEILPPVSYIKAIDVWIFACIIFILASLIEFAIVTYLFTFQLAKNNNSNSIELQQLLFEDEAESLRRENFNTPSRFPIYDQIRSAVEKDVRIIDRVSRILFPVVFCIFNIFYWLKYTNDK